MNIWPLLTIAAAGLQVARNAAQRGLTDKLGLWGASYVRFLYGLPFAAVWLAAIVAWHGPSGAPSLAFAGWVLLGALSQGAATAALVYAMRGRAFAVANVLQKTEVLGSAVLGVVLIGDVMTSHHWLGALLGTAGIVLMAHVSIDRTAFRAALSGVVAGLLFAVAVVAARGAAKAWGGDAWVAAPTGLCAQLLVQTVAGGALLMLTAPRAMATLLREWRPSMAPGAYGAAASTLLWTSFALAPSGAVVKTVQLVDVLIAWGVSRQLKEHIRPAEIAGAALVLAGAIAVLV
jgi:drug/metabolite transporter (DMT)-like permease